MITQRIGILLAIVCFTLGSSARAAINLVQNGEVETGYPTGWTLTPTGDPFVRVNSNGWMEFGSLTPSYLSQTLLGTTPGQAYKFHFELLADTATDTDPSAFFRVSWNNTPLYNLDSLTTTVDWIRKDITVTATDVTTEILFTAQNPASSFRLDNVSVEAVPEPATWAIALSGLGVLAAFRRMRRKTSV